MELHPVVAGFILFGAVILLMAVMIFGAALCARTPLEERHARMAKEDLKWPTT